MSAIWLFLAVPFVTLAASNPGYPLPYRRLLVYYLTLGAILTLIVWLFSIRFTHVARRLPVFLALSIYVVAPMTANVQRVLRAGDWLLEGGIWIALALLISAFLVSGIKLMQDFVPVFGLVLLAWPIGTLGYSRLTAPESASIPVADPWEISLHTTPNIYFFLLDGYGREDVLRLEYRSENQRAFLDELEARAFSVAERAIAPYPMTYLSVSSTLQGEYTADVDDAISDMAPWFEVMQGNNRTVSTLRGLGYTYVQSPPTQYGGTECVGFEDLCVNAGNPIREAEWALLSTTPFGPLLESRSTAQSHIERANPDSRIENLQQAEPTEPFYTFIHLINPHPPYYQGGEDCTLQETRYDLSAPWGTEEYVHAVDCLNRQLLLAIDRILEKDPSAVIILQADHGPNQGISFSDGDIRQWNPHNIWVRFSILAAFRLPDTCTVPDDLNAVNTVRVVIGCLAGEAMPHLPSRAWLANRFPGEIMEIETGALHQLGEPAHQDV